MNLRQSIDKLSLAAVFVLAGTTAILAQQPGGPGGMQSATPGAATQQAIPGQPGSPMQADQQTAPSYADQAFVRATLQDDESQVQLSQLAQEKSSSNDVKQFSQQMVKVHTQLDSQLQPIAKQFDIKDPQKPSKKMKQELTKLQSLSGQEFDAAYLQAMAKDQQHSLKEFTDEEKLSQNPALQKAAKEDSAILNQNYEVLQKLAANHNVAIDEKK